MGLVLATLMFPAASADDQLELEPPVGDVQPETGDDTCVPVGDITIENPLTGSKTEIRDVSVCVKEICLVDDGKPFLCF